MTFKKIGDRDTVLLVGHRNNDCGCLILYNVVDYEINIEKVFFNLRHYIYYILYTHDM